MKDIKDFVFSDDSHQSWLYKDYYYSGSNSRYWTFQIALNLLLQKKLDHPVIIETGCQRMPDDLGAGMSTSIFGRFCQENDGALYTIDLFKHHLDICKKCTLPWSNSISYIESDSIAWLSTSKVPADLLYLDSLDYPITPDGKRSTDKKAEREAQEHCLNEFLAAKRSGILTDRTILLSDDNQLPGGGKPRLLKDRLLKEGWICLMDLQQTLWIKF